MPARIAPFYLARRLARTPSPLTNLVLTTVSFFATVETVPGDPILGLTEAYNADTRPGKVNLGVGIYYDEQGRIPLLDSVRTIEQALAAQARARGYLPIDGLPAYNLATQKLLFGAQSAALDAGRVATSQTVGGSGALRIGADFLKRVLPKAKIAISNPSWENHRVVFAAAGFEVSDHITMLLSHGDESRMPTVFEKFGDYVQQETLADDVFTPWASYNLSHDEVIPLGAGYLAALVEEAWSRGLDLVFLSAGSADVARVYGRLGFRQISTTGVYDLLREGATPESAVAQLT